LAPSLARALARVDDPADDRRRVIACHGGLVGIRGSPDENEGSSSQIKLRTAKSKVFEPLGGVSS
jgi:hypothetical protein